MSDAFKVLSFEELEYLNAEYMRLSLNKNELIFKENAPVTYIIYIRSGIIKIVKSNKKTGDIINLINGPSYIGLSLLYSKNQYPYSAFAASDVELCFLKKERFQKIFATNSSFAQQILKNIGEGEITTCLNTQNIFRKHLAGRIASFLLYLSDKIYLKNRFELPINKSELANLLGISKKSVFRVLVEFKKDKLIEEDSNYIHILNKPVLEKISKSGE